MGRHKTFKYDEGVREKRSPYNDPELDALYSRDPDEVFGFWPEVGSEKDPIPKEKNLPAIKDDEGLLSREETEFAGQILSTLLERFGDEKGSRQYLSSIEVPERANLRIISCVMNTYYRTDIFTVKNLAELNQEKVFGSQKKIKNVRSINVDPAELAALKYLEYIDREKIDKSKRYVVLLIKYFERSISFKGRGQALVEGGKVLYGLASSQLSEGRNDFYNMMKQNTYNIIISKLSTERQREKYVELLQLFYKRKKYIPSTEVLEEEKKFFMETKKLIETEED